MQVGRRHLSAPIKSNFQIVTMFKALIYQIHALYKMGFPIILLIAIFPVESGAHPALPSLNPIC